MLLLGTMENRARSRVERARSCAQHRRTARVCGIDAQCRSAPEMLEALLAAGVRETIAVSNLITAGLGVLHEGHDALLDLEHGRPSADLTGSGCGSSRATNGERHWRVLGHFSTSFRYMTYR